MATDDLLLVAQLGPLTSTGRSASASAESAAALRRAGQESSDRADGISLFRESAEKALRDGQACADDANHGFRDRED